MLDKTWIPMSIHQRTSMYWSWLVCWKPLLQKHLSQIICSATHLKEKLSKFHSLPAEVITLVDTKKLIALANKWNLEASKKIKESAYTKEPTQASSQLDVWVSLLHKPSPKKSKPTSPPHLPPPLKHQIPDVGTSVGAYLTQSNLQEPLLYLLVVNINHHLYLQEETTLLLYAKPFNTVNDPFLNSIHELKLHRAKVPWEFISVLFMTLK